MSKRELIAQHREAILALAAKHGATDVRIFGSVARGDDDETSDIDVIVRFPAGATFEGTESLTKSLEALLGTKVDLATEHRWMKPHFREELERDAIAV